MNTVSKNIKKKLKVLNMSKQEFADKCEVSYSTVIRWLNHDRLPNGYYLKKIANALDCTCDYLTGMEDDKKKKPTFSETLEYEKGRIFPASMDKENVIRLQHHNNVLKALEMCADIQEM